jgi:hypothetical protein
VANAGTAFSGIVSDRQWSEASESHFLLGIAARLMPPYSANSCRIGKARSIHAISDYQNGRTGHIPSASCDWATQSTRPAGCPKRGVASPESRKDHLTQMFWKAVSIGAMLRGSPEIAFRCSPYAFVTRLLSFLLCSVTFVSNRKIAWSTV